MTRQDRFPAPARLALFFVVLAGSAAALPPGPPAALVRGREREASGQLAEALCEFRLATSESPALAVAWVERGRLEGRLGLFTEASASLALATAAEPSSSEAIAQRARLRIRLLDLDGAEKLLDSAADSPVSIERLLAAGQLAAARRDAAAAEEIFRRAAEIDPRRGDAWAGIASARLLVDDLAGVLAACEAALRVEPAHADALALSGYALFRGGDPVGATSRFLAALESDPFHVAAHTYLGNGLVAEPESLSPRPPSGAARSLVRGGAEEWRRGEFRKALDAFREAIDEDPLDGLAHNGFAVALESLADRFAASAGLYAPLSAVAPDVPETRGFLIRGEILSAEEHAVVARSCRPFRRFLPRLVALGATHDMVPLDEAITEPEYGRSFRGRRTFDLRLYDGLRGQGGFQAGTGVEKIAEAAALRYNTFAHELAHQVHLFAMDARDKAEIVRLFDAARAGGRFLDYYAASNAEEYFAVGAEAYVSPRKRAGLAITAGHTRAELLDRDPDLFFFIRGLEQGSAPPPPSTFDRGDSLLARSRFEEAARAYAETPRDSRDRKLALVRAAEAYALAGNLDDAEAALAEASFRAPENDAQAVRSEIRLRRARSAADALAALRDLADLGRRRADLCEALLRTGLLDECEAAARAALDEDPGSSRVRLARARVFFLRGDLEAAEAELRGILRANRAVASVHGELARVLARRGRTEEALAERRLALLAEPRNAEVLVLSGEALLETGAAAGALADFDAVLAADPRHGRALLGRARALLKSGDERGAVSARDAAIARLFEEGDGAGGVPGGLSALAAVAPLGDRLSALAFRAIMRLDRGEWALAETDLARALALSPDARGVLEAELRAEGLPDVAARLAALPPSRR